MKWIALAAALLLAACSAEKTDERPLDAIAPDYVRMTLEIGERDPGYVDAYYGPKEWAEAAKKAPRSLAELAKEAESLRQRTERVDPVGLDPMEARRRAFMLAQLQAATTRLRILQGEKIGFIEEARGLFGVAPELKPVSAYDPVLARIDALVPGSGPLSERVDAFQARFTIPKDRLEPVMRAAIAECRRRTLQHIPLPKDEKFTLEFVTGKSWSGYNYYQGNAHSLIQVNTDLPARIGRAIDLGCHEGYPGHHVLNMLMEQSLTRDRKWVEFSVYPLYSPQSLIAEGTANYGIDLAFPGDEKLRFETATLYPLAGLPTRDAAAYTALGQAMKDLAGARFTIVRDYLDGRIDRAEAVRLTRHYQLVSRERAEQTIDFADQYRSYVINYGLGEDMARRSIESAGTTPEARWSAMRHILSEPTLPSDLAK